MQSLCWLRRSRKLARHDAEIKLPCPPNLAPEIKDVWEGASPGLAEPLAKRPRLDPGAGGEASVGGDNQRLKALMINIQRRSVETLDPQTVAAFG